MRDCALLRLRVSVCVCLFIGVRVQGLAGVSSTSPPGGNQVDGLPPAPVRDQHWASWESAREKTFVFSDT